MLVKIAMKYLSVAMKFLLIYGTVLCCSCGSKCYVVEIMFTKDCLTFKFSQIGVVIRYFSHGIL